MKSRSKITRGTTNVLADLGYADAVERQTKTRLALAINELLTVRKLNQREIATLHGVSHNPEAWRRRWLQSTLPSYGHPRPAEAPRRQDA